MGTVIDRVLRAEGLVPQEAMELDSSEVIVGMVTHGLGAAVVPSGRLRNVPSDAVSIIAFGNPPISRRVVLVERVENTGAVLVTLVVYNLALIGVGLWARSRNRDVADYFLAGRGLGPWVAAISASAAATGTSTPTAIRAKRSSPAAPADSTSWRSSA